MTASDVTLGIGLLLLVVSAGWLAVRLGRVHARLRAHEVDRARLHQVVRLLRDASHGPLPRPVPPPSDAALDELEARLDASTQ